MFSWSNLLPKNELQSECHVFLFGSKTNKFCVFTFKKDAISKQSATMVSVTNKRAITKKANTDNFPAAVVVDLNGDLSIGGNHWKMKSSTRNLIINKDTLSKYFEAYDRKEMFGA